MIIITLSLSCIIIKLHYYNFIFLKLLLSCYSKNENIEADGHKLKQIQNRRK